MLYAAQVWTVFWTEIFLPINGMFSVQLPICTLSSKTKQGIALKVDVLLK